MIKDQSTHSHILCCVHPEIQRPVVFDGSLGDRSTYRFNGNNSLTRICDNHIKIVG
jgi:hypothetical protein